MLQPLLHVFPLFLHPFRCYLVIHIIGDLYVFNPGDDNSSVAVHPAERTDNKNRQPDD
jgi:hypothetical protein